VGDVVVFDHPSEQGRIVHRGVAAETGSLRTKGDNSVHLDDWALQPEDLASRVVAIRRHGRLLPVPENARKAILAFQVKRKLDQLISWLLRPIYRKLSQIGLFRGCLEPRLLSFSRPDGVEWQLWVGNWLVGRKLPTWTTWSISRPFRLFLDEASLPQSGSHYIHTLAP